MKLAGDLVQIVLHHAVVDNAQAKQTQNQVQNGVVIVGDASGLAAFVELLLSQEESQERQQNHQHDFQDTVIFGVGTVKISDRVQMTLKHMK